MLLFIRLRALAFELCRDHPVAFCETCQRGYTSEELGTDVGNGCYRCRHCGMDLRASLATHARTCRHLVMTKSLTRMPARSDAAIPVGLGALPSATAFPRRQIQA